MASGIFRESRLKIEWANKHIQLLSSVIAAFLETHPYGVTVENNSGSDALSEITFQSYGNMPDAIPLIIGDALHNLRSSLDIAVCYAVRLGAGTPDRYTGFPVAQTREKLIASQRNRKIKTHAPILFDLIVDEIKPYQGGNDLLCALHDLDVLDKHRLLVPVVSYIGLRDISGRPQRIDISIQQGATLTVIARLPDLNVKDYGDPTFDIFFNEGQILKGQPVLPTLHQFSQLVSGIIDAFRDVYIVSDRSV